MFTILSNILAVIKEYLGTMSTGSVVTLNVVHWYSGNNEQEQVFIFLPSFFDRKHQWLISCLNRSKDKATKT